MIYRFREFELDRSTYELRRDGILLNIQPQVFTLLELLISNHNRVVTKKEIEQVVWNGRAVSGSAINSRISAARTAIGDHGKEQHYLKTIHSRGYRFIDDVKLCGTEKRHMPDKSMAADLSVKMPIGHPEIQNGSISTSPKLDHCIAVMQFRSVPDDPDLDVFAQSLHNDVVIALSKIPGLSVAVGTSPPADPDGSSNIPDRNALPTAQYVLEGSIRCWPESTRVTVQLIDASTGRCVWGNRYERKNKSMLDVHDEMTREIVSAIQIELSSGEQARVWNTGTENFEAWETLVEARKLCLTHRKQSVLKGRKLAQHANNLDPSYLSALHWLAYSHWAEAHDGWGECAKQSLQKAASITDKALELEKNDANIYSLKSMICTTQRKHDEAVTFARQAMALGPGNAHVFSNSAMVMVFAGQLEESIIAVKKAKDYGPVCTAGTAAIHCNALFLKGDVEKAIAEAKNCLQIDPDYIYAHCTLAVMYSEQGQHELARDAVMQIQLQNPGYTTHLYASGQAYRDGAILDRFITGLRRAGLPA